MKSGRKTLSETLLMDWARVLNFNFIRKSQKPEILLLE
jgi:hypothetical protein